MRPFAYITVWALLTGAAFAQPTETNPQFDAVDVHPSARTNNAFVQGPFYGGGRYELRFATMVDLIHVAYSIDAERVFGGPSWIEMDRFDVIAMAPPGSTPESRRLMLQAVLAGRFHLVTHNDTRPMAAYRLTAGKTPKLQPAEGTGETGCNFKVESMPPRPAPSGDAPQERPQVIQLPVLSYTCRNTTMAALAAAMTGIPGVSFDNKPVVDQTDLTGAWDFALRYTPRIPAGLATSGQAIPFLDAVDQQLGLKLELATAPLPVLVVDSATEKPTANSPDIAKNFPPVPTEFDVAEIKPSAPALSAGRGGGAPEVKNGRVILPGITLQNLILVAWDLTTPDALIGAPKWLNSDRFDVIAKAPAGVAIGDLTPTSSRSIPVNLEALRPMLRSLLLDRFKLAVHTEDRPMTAYTLVAVKPKLQKADPSARTKWMEAPAGDSKDPRNANPVLGRLVKCQNITMAQFAEMLPGIAPGYVHTEVVDATGLEGGWDFTISFSGAGQLQGGGRGDGPSAAPGGATEASDPSGGISLFDALSKQLGLKLETQKRPMPVVVIDRVEQKPTDN